jgi:alpha-amylase
MDQLADECYLPANRLLLELIRRYQGAFRISFSISGTALEQLNRLRPDVVQSFSDLVATGCVEILGETYYHSLSSLHSVREWKEQVDLHRSLIRASFGLTPIVYRNTELIHDNDLASLIKEEGFSGILCEGVAAILRGRSPNRLYCAPGSQLPLLLRNPNLSDDIAFRFDDPDWSERPLTAEKFAEWIHSHPPGNEVINLFMDYETLGLHNTAESGIFQFMEALPSYVLSRNGFGFSLPSEVISQQQAVDTYDVKRRISWEDRGEAACVWSEHPMQHNMLGKIYSLENTVMNAGSGQAIRKWRMLQSADHFYFMNDRNQKYKNPYPSEQEAGSYYLKVVNDLELALIQKGLEKTKKYGLLRHAALGIF